MGKPVDTIHKKDRKIDIVRKERDIYMKTVFKVFTFLAFLAVAAYGVLQLIDRVYEGLGSDYVEFPCDGEDEG